MADQDTEQIAIQFYWDVGSTNSYFAFHLLRPIAEEFGAAIEYIPFNLGYVFRHHKYVLSEEPKAKLKNRATDLKRWAKKYSLPFNVPEQFPIKTSDALKGSLVMRRFGLEEAILCACQLLCVQGQRRSKIDPEAFGTELGTNSN